MVAGAKDAGAYRVSYLVVFLNKNAIEMDTNKTIWITGATSGLGKAAAIWFAARGWNVAFCGRRTDKGKEVAKMILASGGQAVFIPADVTQEAEVIRMTQEALDRYGPPAAAFNNAGGNFAFGPLTAVSAETFEKILAVNLTAVFHCLKHEITAMQAGGGSIVNTASTAAVKGISRGLAAYTAAKHGVIGLTKCAALETASQGIRINALVLGAVATDTWPEKVSKIPGQVEKIAEAIPVGKVGTPDDVMPLLEYLAGTGSAYMTGAAVTLDGGVTAGWP